MVVRGLDPVGTGRQVELLATGLRDRGHDVHVGVLSAGGGLPARLSRDGHAVHALGMRPVVDAAAAARFVAIARRLRPDAVLACGRSLAAPAAAVAIAVPRVRVAAWVGVPRFDAVAGRALGMLDRVIATSPGVAAACGRRGVATDSVVVVPPGIVADPGAGRARAEVAARLGLDPATRWTVCVASLEWEARLERLVWAIDQLGVVRRDVEHVLVGSGPLRRRVLRRARVQELAERLVVVPHCDLLPDLIREAVLTWQTGDVACGGAILDAMAGGVPAVAVAGDATRQLVVDGETGRLVPALPESELPRRAFNLLEDPDLAARYGAAARRRAETEFAVGPMVAGVAAALGLG